MLTLLISIWYCYWTISERRRSISQLQAISRSRLTPRSDQFKYKRVPRNLNGPDLFKRAHPGCRKTLPKNDGGRKNVPQPRKIDHPHCLCEQEQCLEVSQSPREDDALLKSLFFDKSRHNYDDFHARGSASCVEVSWLRTRKNVDTSRTKVQTEMKQHGKRHASIKRYLLIPTVNKSTIEPPALPRIPHLVHVLSLCTKRLSSCF